ncbi:MAG: GAF domain-containing protein, partial [Candidatus Zixiibacteriota bacterium]
MSEEYPVKYEVLRQLALGGAAGDELQQTVEKSLRQTATIVGLQAAAMYLWDNEMNIDLAVAHADNDASRQRLDNLERDLFSSLRKDRKLISAYMSFGGEKTVHSFTLPLRHGERVFGALIGLQEGARTLV